MAHFSSKNENGPFWYRYSQFLQEIWASFSKKTGFLSSSWSGHRTIGPHIFGPVEANKTKRTKSRTRPNNGPAICPSKILNQHTNLKISRPHRTILSHARKLFPFYFRTWFPTGFELEFSRFISNFGFSLGSTLCSSRFIYVAFFIDSIDSF